jgi:hypothetical protein
MHLSALDLLAAVVFGSAASLAGGYFAGAGLGGKFIGRDLAGFLGMLYGPAAGATGVVVGAVVVSLLAARS